MKCGQNYALILCIFPFEDVHVFGRNM